MDTDGGAINDPVDCAPLDLAAMPVLGERLAVDFVNTRYRRGGIVLDFLATPAHVALWAEAVGSTALLGSAMPDGADLRALRDASRSVLEAVVDGVPVSEHAVRAVNRAAERAPVVRSLSVVGGGLVMHERATGAPEERRLALLALDVIQVAAGSESARLSRCARPDCSMLILRTHHLRRYCTPSCAHVDRQRRYIDGRRGADRSSRAG